MAAFGPKNVHSAVWPALTAKIPSQNYILSKSIVCGEMNVIPRDQPCWDERRNSI